jgi:HD-like signal output (HDOD) protein
LSVVPPFPPIATRLLDMLARTAVNIKDLADVISSDPMFTGRILQHANSAEFGLQQPIRSIRHALTTLGIDATRRITIAAATGAYSKVALRTADLRRCWEHTVATAVLSEEIAVRCGSFTESAYSGGIMHDIGRLGLVVAYPSLYEKTLRHAAEHCIDLLDHEREVFGMDHAEAGCLLTARWKLPEDFQIIAGRHHDPCEGTELTLLRIVHVACRLADYFHYDVTQPLKTLDYAEVVAELPERVHAGLLGIDQRQLHQKIEEHVRGLSTVVEHEDPQTEWKSAAAGLSEESEKIDVRETPSPIRQSSLARFFGWLWGSSSHEPA